MELLLKQVLLDSGFAAVSAASGKIRPVLESNQAARLAMGPAALQTEGDARPLYRPRDGTVKGLEFRCGEEV